MATPPQISGHELRSAVHQEPRALVSDGIQSSLHPDGLTSVSVADGAEVEVAGKGVVAGRGGRDSQRHQDERKHGERATVGRAELEMQKVR